MSIRPFSNDRRKRLNFGGLYCPKCGGKMLAGSTPGAFARYYCTNDHCENFSQGTKVSREREENV